MDILKKSVLHNTLPDLLGAGFYHLSADQYSRLSGFTESNYVHTYGNEYISGNKTFYNNVSILGNLYVSGTTVTVDNLNIIDNIITINSGETGSGVTLRYSGVEVDRGLYPNYVFIFDESGDTFRIGETGDTQAVATREDTPLQNAVAIWNSGETRFETSSSLTWNNIQIKVVRVPISDADYVVTGVLNQNICYTSITAKRTVTLPPATTENQIIRIIDEDGNTTPTNRIKVVPDGSDTIEDDIYNIQISPYDDIAYQSNGAGNWVITAQQAILSTGVVLPPAYSVPVPGSVTLDNLGLYNLFKLSTGNGIVRTFEIDGNTFVLADETLSYIVVNYNAGSPIMEVVTDVDLINETTIIPLYTIYRSGTILHLIDWDSLGLALVNKLHQSIVKTQRYRLESGLGISESAVRRVVVADGRVWVGANRVNILSFTSVTDSLFFLYHVGGVWQTPSAITQYNNTQYDNGTNLATLTNNRFAVNFVYRGVEVYKHCYIVLGQGDYTLLQAQASLPPTNLPRIITSHAVLVGRIIVEKNAAVATQIDSAFSTTFAISSTGVHNDLGGLYGATPYYHSDQPITTSANVIFNSLSATTISATTLYYQGQELDTRFVNVTGDTMTGNLTINANLTVTGDTLLQTVTAITYFGDGSNITGVIKDLSSYYNSAQTDANFLSANTSYYTQEQSDANFLSATTNTFDTLNVTSLSASTERIITTSGSSLLQNYLSTDTRNITNSTLITALLLYSNWSGTTYYGTTTGAVEGQEYVGTNYLYKYNNSVFTRYRKSDINISLYTSNDTGITSITATTNIEYVVYSGASNFTIWLPAANTLIFNNIFLKNISSGTTLTVSSVSSLIDGATTQTLVYNSSLDLISLNNNYYKKN